MVGKVEEGWGGWVGVSKTREWGSDVDAKTLGEICKPEGSG